MCLFCSPEFKSYPTFPKSPVNDINQCKITVTPFEPDFKQFLISLNYLQIFMNFTHFRRFCTIS